MPDQSQAAIERIARIKGVPTILEVICRTTGMGFAAVARVTENRWIACSVLDQIQFGLKPGGELKVDTTICHEIRQSLEPVVIDHVEQDEVWCRHATPALYGFQSYISMPIILEDGSFFGTLCAIDPKPALLRTPETIGMFRLFAELIAKHLDSDRKLADTESALHDELEVAQLREQFIAILGHDLRTPLRAIASFSQLMLRARLEENVAEMATIIRDSALRMSELIDNLLDLARGRLRGGITLVRNHEVLLEPILQEVVAELTIAYPDRTVETEISLPGPIECDPGRIAQLASNLLSNALTYGSAKQSVWLRAASNSKVFELSVANTGEAIPPDVLKHLFEPFFHSGTLHAKEGLGLGLYIVQEIAKAHKGEVTVTSTNEETRFTFVMPTA